MRPNLSRWFLSCSLLVTGCQLTPTFTTGYPVESTRLRPSPIAAKLAVVPFSEGREPRYYNTTGRLFLLYIPFIPRVTLRFERLEESIRIQSDAIAKVGSGMTLGAKQTVAPPFDDYYFPNSFAKAIARDLGAIGLFEEVEYRPNGSASDSRYVLRGTLVRSPLRNSVTAFGLGPAGVLLWLLPLPMQKTSGEIGLDLELIDNETGAIVWQRNLTSRLHRYVTLYTSSAMVYGRGGAYSLNVIPPPADAKVDRRSLFSWHFEALRRAMLDSRGDLAQALQAHR